MGGYTVPRGTYQYSCMSELKDGTVGLLFYYTNMDFNTNSTYNASFTTGTYELVL